MITALRRVSTRHFRSHKLRSLFTVGGIALGVATMIAMRLLHASVARSYEHTIESIAGKAVLQVTNGEVGVPEEMLQELQAVPGVGAVAASVQGFVSLPRHAGERLYVFGIDLLADQELRSYQTRSADAVVEDPLAFLAQADSIAASAEFLAATHLALGDPLEVLAPSGRRTLTVRASLDVSTGPASLFGGRLAVMDVFAAQRLFDLDRRFTEIDLGIEEGGDLAALTAAVTQTVGGRGLVETPRTRGETLEKLLTSNRYSMTLAAMLAIVVGLYLIFNTMMVAVAQRGREIGVLRALGMTRADVMRWIIAEAVLLGAVGCAVGVPLGVGMARGMSRAFALNLSALYMPISESAVALDANAVAWGVGLGLLSALVAAAVPARAAVRVHPLEVLRPAGGRAAGRGLYNVAAAVGALIAVVAMGGWLARAALPVSKNALGAAAILGVLFGVSLVVPAAVRAFALRSEPLLSRLLGPVGSLASRAIVGHIGRVAITCSAFLVSLAGAIAIATWLSSLERTMTVWMDGIFSNIDLVISSGARPLGGDAIALPGSLAEEIATLPGVHRVDAVRLTKVTHEGLLTNLIATDARLYLSGTREITLLDGSAAEVLPALVAGRGVAVNEAFTLRFGKHVGDVVRLPSAAGAVALPIVGVYFDPAFADLGIVLMDRQLYRRQWRDDTVNMIEPALETGADREQVIRAIRERWGEKHALFIATIEQFRAEADQLLRQSMLIVYPLVAISIAIALLGVVNSLLASVLDRIREIGVLRAVGATRRQIVRSVVLEAALIGLLGGVLAVAVGSLLGYVQIDVIFRGMFGMTVLYRYPTAAVVFSVVAAVVLAALAGYLPGRNAGRLRITDALEYE